MKYGGEFLARNLGQVGKLGVSADQIQNAQEVIEETVGAEWLQSEGLRQDRGSPMQEFTHPLGRALQGAGPQQILELLELAKYLATARGWPGFERMRHGLRGDYPSTLLQLAAAFRFHRIGGQNMQLEPPIQSGSADISFEWNETPFLVECYQQRPSGRDVHPEAFRATEKILREFQSHPGCVDIAIALREPLTQSMRVALVKQIRLVAKGMPLPVNVEPIKHHVMADMAYLNLPYARVSIMKLHARLRRRRESFVHPDFSGPQGPPSTELFQTLVPGDAIAAEIARRLPPPWVRVRLWVNDADVKKVTADSELLAAMEKLSMRLESDKLRQTKGEKPTARLLVVETALVRKSVDPNDWLMRPIRERLLDRHPSLLSVLFVNRNFGGRPPRYYYSLRPILRSYSRGPGLQLAQALWKAERDEKIPALREPTL